VLLEPTNRDAFQSRRPGLLDFPYPAVVMSTPRKQNNPARIAVIDDHASFRAAVCRTLASHGYVAEEHESVTSFIAAGGIVRVDCLVLDVKMPGIGGLSLQDCLQRTNYPLPVIFCSGVEDEAIRREALAKGAISFLRKPIEPSALFRALKTALSRGFASKLPIQRRP